VVVGAQISNTANVQLGYAATLSSNLVSVSTYMPTANTVVAFPSVTTSNIAANTLYYTSNVSGSGPWTYNISATPGGTPLTFTNGSATMSVNIQVTAVNTNANVVLNAYPAGNGTATAVSSRILNTNLATFKNWTVTG